MLTDKREVLFSGSEELEKLIACVVASAPKAMAPLDVVVAALAASSPAFEARRAIARKRQALIAAHAELRERELIRPGHGWHRAGRRAAEGRGEGARPDVETIRGGPRRRRGLHDLAFARGVRSPCGAPRGDRVTHADLPRGVEGSARRPPARGRRSTHHDRSGVR